MNYIIKIHIKCEENLIRQAAKFAEDQYKKLNAYKS